MTNAAGTIANEEPKEEEIVVPEATDVETPAVEPAAEPEAKPTIEESMEDAFAKYEAKPEVGADGKPVEKKSALPSSPGITPAPAPAKPIDPVTGRELEPIKAPYGIPLTLKDKWGGMDRDMQKYWSDREKHIQTTLQSVADERRVATEFKSTIAPYEPLFKHFNMTGTDHVKDLLALSHELNAGTPQQKAATFVRLMNHFRPDKDTMVALFNGQQVSVPGVRGVAPQGQPQQQPAQQRTPEQIEEDAVTKHQVTNDVRAFIDDPRNEFAPYVHAKMAQLLGTDLLTGDTLPEQLQSAYDIACNTDPAIKSELARRATQQPLQAPVTTAAVAAPTRTPIVGAKPSLSGGSRGTAPKPKAGATIDDVLNDAMRKHGID